MEHTMKQTTIDRIVDLNNRIFDQERIVDDLTHAVSAQRYYLAADKTAERVLELRGAMANLRAERDRLAALQSKMDDELANIFNEDNWSTVKNS